MEIDSGRQQATVASLESVRAARQADVQCARQQAERMKKLFDAGAVSQQEYEQAATSVQTARGATDGGRGADPEQRVELGYHRVTAPTAGIVGDIPVRVGDRVTASDDADDGRRERGARALHQRAGGAGAGPEARHGTCASSTTAGSPLRRRT